MEENGRINHNAVNSLISMRDAADLEADSLDQGSSYNELSGERQARTYDVMTSLNSTVAKKVLPQVNLDASDERVAAATVIQSHYRGYVDRCKFLAMLYEQFEQEEAGRKERATEQVEEGELLVANHRLEVALEDTETAVKNKQLLHQSRVITIQRAWRAYKRRQLRDKSTNLQTENDSECSPSSPGCRRKSLILNKAQEFVDLKKQFDEVLPYNAHKATPLTDSSEDSSLYTSTDNSPSTESLTLISNLGTAHKSCADSEVTLPQLDWTALEHNITDCQPAPLKATANSKSVKDAHREDVRKRLAMNTPSQGLYSDVYTRPPPKPYRAQNNTMELYMNDCNDETTNSPATGDDSDKDLVSQQQKLHEQATVAYIQAGPIAKRLIEFEKMAEEPSQIARMLGISTLRSQGEVTLDEKRLSTLTLAQLQVVYNAMQNEIERLNEELVEIVVARDELHMQQDSILVNIEDLEQRIEELSQKHQKKVEQKAAKKTATNEPQIRSTSRMSRLFRLGRTS